MAVKTFTLVSSNVNDLEDAPLVVVAVVRQRRIDAIEVGCFLVDTGCLGVKDAWLETYKSSQSFDEFRGEMFPGDYLEKSGAWGRRFVEASIVYARRLRFSPARDYKKAARVFGGINASDCVEKFKFGLAGKPYYCQGPIESNEVAQKIIRQLTSICGEDGFEYVLLASLGIDELPEQVNIFIGMAETGEAGDLEHAREGLQQLYAMYPDAPGVAFGLAVLHLIREEPEMSMAYLEDAIDRDPEFGLAWYNKAVLHKQYPDQVAMMLRAFQQSIRYHTEGDEYLDMAEGFIRGFTREAEEDCGITLDAYIKAAEVFTRAWQMIDDENWEAGLAGMKQVTESNPKSHQAFGNMGFCLVKLDRVSEAKVALRAALEIKPDYAVARRNLDALERFDDKNIEPQGV